jgi:hypothetical protein
MIIIIIIIIIITNLIKGLFQEMVFKIKQQCQMNNTVNIPVVFSATGVIHIMLNQSKNNLNLPPSSMTQVHKLVTQTKLIIIMCEPQSWIIKPLELIGIKNKIISCTMKAMSYWKTSMRIHTEGKIIETEHLEMKREIFPEDSL